jgi:hypothetical protein
MFKKPKLNKQNKFRNYSVINEDENENENDNHNNNQNENESKNTFNKRFQEEKNYQNLNFNNEINKNDLSLNEENFIENSNKNKNESENFSEKDTQNSEETNFDKLLKLKANIDNNKFLNSKKRETIKIEKKYEPNLSKEEQADRGIKKIFISENELTNTKDNPEEYKKLVGIKKEEIDDKKENQKKKILEHQKDLFTLPKDLEVMPQTKNDYVENLIRLSAAGLIEVPLSLENKLKNIEATEVMKKQSIDKRLAEELDYIKVLKKNGPSYAKGYKNDISHKKLSILKNVFENVFNNLNGRKRKLLKEKMILDNKVIEYGYDPTGGKKLDEEDDSRPKRNNICIPEDEDSENDN